jgi:hypothetical protein
MSKITTIIDHIGRTVIGEIVSETEATLTLNNPVIIHVQPNPQTGQLQVQSIPYIFMEFLEQASRAANHWTFNRSSIVQSEVQLDSKIIAQYNGINTPAPQAAPTGDAEVIKLFED